MLGFMWSEVVHRVYKSIRDGSLKRVVEAWKLGGYAPGGEEVRGYRGVEKSRAAYLPSDLFVPI